ncbi:hypothetical protein RvY_11096 [Ramazzottius varieornatus]|uniref:Exocyst complex component 8 n=1 Tax=Ramazzottius varieornatus TaxID=947166 RepID=A0A1D1VMT1_RAMVA|nr:hypothetical protein RvY_11096 [Ramazzottius varieornatus]
MEVDGTTEALYSEDFDANEFLSGMIAGGDIKSQLEESWRSVEQVRDKAMAGIRDSAFRYHSGILTASREIRTLENELEELRGVLLEEAGTLEQAMSDFSAQRVQTGQGDNVASLVAQQKTQQGRRKSTRFARKSVFGHLNKIEGFDHEWLKNRDRYFVGNRDLDEYDIVSLKRMHDLIVIIFSDCLILTLWTPHHAKNTHTEYKFVELVHLDKTEASVYVPDKESKSLAAQLHLDKLQINFKLHAPLPVPNHNQNHSLRFPFILQTLNHSVIKLFDCESEEERTDWIETLNKLSKELEDQNKIETATKKAIEIGESLDNIMNRYRNTPTHAEVLLEKIPPWFREGASDIEDHVEMREYNEAVEIVLRAQKFWQRLKDWPTKRGALDLYRRVVKAREKLIKSMLEPLRCTMDCPMGFDRPMVVELIGLTKMLGVVYSAAMLYLDHRSRVVALAVEAVKPEDSALNYVRKCCEVLFELISQTVEEFASLQLMDSQHRPALLGWTRYRLQLFCGQLSPVIFGSQMTMAALAYCIQQVRNAAISTSAVVKIDLLSTIDAAFEEECVSCIDQYMDMLIEDFLAGHKESNFLVISFDNKESMRMYLSQQKSMEGLGSLLPYFDNLTLKVAQEFVRFGQAFLQFTRDMCTICHGGMRRQAELWLSRGAAAAVQILKEGTMVSQYAAVRAEALDELLYATTQFLTLNVFNGAQDIFTKKFGPCEYFLFVEKDTLEELAQELKARLKK